jgi:hypothetical protein
MMEDQEITNKFLEHYLKKSAKRGNVYEYPIKIKDLSKMPRFRDTEFKHSVLENCYENWRKSSSKEQGKGFYCRHFSKIWKMIADELFGEMEDNYQGVTLPHQLGVLYLGTPPNKDYFVMIDKPKYKHIVWRTKIKYINRDLKYYNFHSYHKRYKSATERDDYYKTAKEKMPLVTYIR